MHLLTGANQKKSGKAHSIELERGVRKLLEQKKDCPWQERWYRANTLAFYTTAPGLIPGSTYGPLNEDQE